MSSVLRKVWESKHFVLLPYAVLVTFGWWLPNDLLDHFPGLRAFSDVMASVVPQIDRVTKLGGAAFGQTNRLLYSVLWLMLLMVMPVFVVSQIRHVLGHGFDPNQRRISLWQLLVLVPFGLLLGLDGFYFYWVDPSLRIIHFGIANRIGIGLMAPLLVAGPPLLFFSACLLLWGAITNRISIGSA